MDLQFADQPAHHFRFFDLFGEPKKIARSINGYEQIPLVTLEEAVEPLIVFIPQIKHMVKLVKEKCQQPKDNLTIDESASIMLYTIECIPREESFYYIFNRKLHTDDNEELKPWYFYIKLISISLSKLPMVSKRIFYRGIKDDLKTGYSLRKTFFWYGYSSCISSIEILNKKEFGFGEKGNRTLFIIHGDQGKNIGQHSFYKTDYEILLPPGQRFEVVSYKESNDGLRVIILKEISLSDFIEKIPIMIVNDEDDQTSNLLLDKRMKKCPKYSEFNFRNLKLTDNDMPIIVNRVISKKKCTWLSFQNNKITSNGVSIIADGLKQNIYLESLYLSHNCVTDIGVKCLTDVLSNNYLNLTLLALDYNCIKDDGARFLSHMLRLNQTLTDLWLAYNEISSYGVKLLANVLTFDNSTLIQLYLHGNKLIDDSSIDSLVRMLRCNSSLNTLWLQNCSLSQAGKEKLEKIAKFKGDFDLYV